MNKRKCSSLVEPPLDQSYWVPQSGNASDWFWRIMQFHNLNWQDEIKKLCDAQHVRRLTQNLPESLLVVILGCLSPYDWIEYRRVCKRWLRCQFDPFLWEHAFRTPKCASYASRIFQGNRGALRLDRTARRIRHVVAVHDDMCWEYLHNLQSIVFVDASQWSTSSLETMISHNSTSLESLCVDIGTCSGVVLPTVLPRLTQASLEFSDADSAWTTLEYLRAAKPPLQELHLSLCDSDSPGLLDRIPYVQRLSLADCSCELLRDLLVSGRLEVFPTLELDLDPNVRTSSDPVILKRLARLKNLELLSLDVGCFSAFLKGMAIPLPSVKILMLTTDRADWNKLREPFLFLTGLDTFPNMNVVILHSDPSSDFDPDRLSRVLLSMAEAMQRRQRSLTIAVGIRLSRSTAGEDEHAQNVRRVYFRLSIDLALKEIFTSKKLTTTGLTPWITVAHNRRLKTRYWALFTK